MLKDDEEANKFEIEDLSSESISESNSVVVESDSGSDSDNQDEENETTNSVMNDEGCIEKKPKQESSNFNKGNQEEEKKSKRTTI
jgi:hypothetical protein